MRALQDLTVKIVSVSENIGFIRRGQLARISPEFCMKVLNLSVEEYSELIYYIRRYPNESSNTIALRYLSGLGYRMQDLRRVVLANTEDLI